MIQSISVLFNGALNSLIAFGFLFLKLTSLTDHQVMGSTLSNRVGNDRYFCLHNIFANNAILSILIDLDGF